MMGDHMLTQMTNTAAPSQVYKPDPARLVSGDPVHSLWILFSKNGLDCGIWSSTPGAWRVHFDEWEYVNILSGHSIVHSPDGTAVHLRSGDRYFIPQGFEGIWEVVETTSKDFVSQTFPAMG